MEEIKNEKFAPFGKMLQQWVVEVKLGFCFVNQKKVWKILPLAVEHHKFLYVNPLEHKHQCMAK